jgi:hypothetical protein
MRALFSKKITTIELTLVDKGVTIGVAKIIDNDIVLPPDLNTEQIEAATKAIKLWISTCDV